MKLHSLTLSLLALSLSASIVGCAKDQTTIETRVSVSNIETAESIKEDTIDSIEKDPYESKFIGLDGPIEQLFPITSQLFNECYNNDVDYIEINGNVPCFTENDLTTDPFEIYSDFDNLGRCGVAYANICKEIMPTEKRGDISKVKPTGWKTYKFDNVDGGYLYNRCHLIGFQLAGENANDKNLITGTRWLNVQGMLPFENMVADYVDETNNHVLYRVTPDFWEDDLVVHGVYMEAKSVEDNGEGVQFAIYVFNTQPGIEIDYATGEAELIENVGKENNTETEDENLVESGSDVLILNTKTKKYHKTSCSSAKKIQEENKEEYEGNKNKLDKQGYSPCGICKP